MEVDELRVAKVAKQLHAQISHQLSLLAHHTSSPNANLPGLLADIHQFQPCPQLLHHHLNEYVTIILSAYISHNSVSQVTEVFYTLSKIVGSKKMLNYFQTDVSLIPQLTQRYLSQDQIHWHEKYLLLCWLTVLVLAPFRLDTFQEDIKTQLHQIGHAQLKDSGPLQPLAARLIGSMIMRSDCDDLFQKFIKEIVKNYDAANGVLRQGYLFAFNVALHKDSNDKMMDITSKMVEFFIRERKDDEGNIDLKSKILSKLSKNLEILDDLEGIEIVITWFEIEFSHKNTDTRFTLARQYSKMLTRIDECLSIDLMLEMLDNAHQLASESADYVNSDRLHSYLLCLAELLRLGLVDVNGFDKLVETLNHTFFFQQTRITHIAGSNIRDASNFIAWSLAKYQRKTLEPNIVMSIFTDLLQVSCFDKEIIIRRSATAALQELIGRHGVSTWSHFYPDDEQNSARSIRVIEILDYVDLGSLEKSYLQIPEKLIEIFPSLKPRFIAFLIDNVYNMDTELAKLSSKSLCLLLTTSTSEVRDNAITCILQNANKKPTHAFLALSELLQLHHTQEILDTLIPLFTASTINHHKDTPFTITSYLSLLTVLIPLSSKILTPTTLNNVFDAIRINSPDIIIVLNKLVPLLNIDTEHWSKWLHYIKNNNINTASTVASLPIFKTHVEDVMDLLKTETVDAVVKARILESISAYLTRGEFLSDEIKLGIVEQLNDYSVSEQGDVGSKVRLSCIRLITENKKVFDGDLRPVVETKLIRLAVEPIDRLRIEAVKLLMSFFGSNEVLIDTRDLGAYFSQFLGLFQTHFSENKDATLELLRGYIFSAGALKATDTLITASLHSFSTYYLTLSPESQHTVLIQLCSLLKPDTSTIPPSSSHHARLTKQILVGLQFLTRLLLTNIPIPPSFPLKGLYIRVHNLHLSTKNMTRLSCAIKIFGYLYLAHDLVEGKQRLIALMTTHPLARVRQLASEELYLVYQECLLKSGDATGKYEDAIKVIQDVDWSGKDVKMYKDKIDI